MVGIIAAMVRTAVLHWAGLAGRVRRRFREDRLGQVASSLAFTTLLALVPLFTIMLTVVSAFPMFEGWSIAFKRFLLTTLVPESAGRVISVYMLQFSSNANKLTAIGLVILVGTAISLMMTIEAAFNGIWRVQRHRPLGVRLTTYWAVMTAGPVIVGAGVSVTSALTGMAVGAARGLPALAELIAELLPLTLSVLSFAALYLTVPNRSVERAHALIGGLVAGVGFEVTRLGFAAYVKLFPTFKLVYGAFASLPLFLISLYLTWWVVMLGAVVAAELGTAED
ncbi:MAG: YihY family inner membrane protein [Burkholderiales bacterium]|jgi:membrane protein